MLLLLLNKKTAASLKKKLGFKEKSAKGFNAKKFNGILKLKADALKIQRKYRNEWQQAAAGYK